MCRLAAGHDTGGQWTDEKADAIEAVESDPRGAVRRLLALYNAAAQEVERLRGTGRRATRQWTCAPPTTATL